MKSITASQLSKVFPNGKRALNAINLSIDEGEIFGFLGPNGSGKTTAVKLLNGMLQLTEGSCSVFGIDPASAPEKVHALAGVVTEHAQMYNNLTGFQNLLFFGEVFGINIDETKRRALEILERLSLLDAKDQKLLEYSTGMRQRLSLARAMLHQPKVLFLDEPTSGLDPESAQSVNNLIKSLAHDKGTTVFLCTHQLRYAEEICTKYGLINEGNMLATGSFDELHALVSSKLMVTINADKYEVDSQEEIPALVKQIVDSGGKVYNVVARKYSLEEIYFALNF
ncbi:MAG: ABC transporter ATP-binding protein [Fibromonadaceae bacterium]|jgi:ABC-2 type transport system ATP-binding protein|nr:ABC transporter ATP-binding protein [Fibromonadaceae bacterium]